MASKEAPRARSQTAPAASGLPMHVLERLDDVQRKGILMSVKLGKLSIDEALKFVQEYYDAETKPLAPAGRKISEEEADEICDAIDRSAMASVSPRDTTSRPVSDALLSHFGLTNDDPVASPAVASPAVQGVGGAGEGRHVSMPELSDAGVSGGTGSPRAPPRRRVKP